MNIHDVPPDSSVPGFFAASSTTSPGKIGKLLGKSTEVKGAVFLQGTDGKIISVSGQLLENTKAEKKALKENKGTVITVKENGVKKKVLIEIDQLAHKLGLSEADHSRSLLMQPMMSSGMNSSVGF